jgi:predicted RNase H-like nuclease
VSMLTRMDGVAVALRNRSVKRCGVYTRFQALLDDHPDASVVGVDIPIGFPVSGAREADALARRFVRPRHSSVFSTPPRSVLEAASYQDALGRPATWVSRASLSRALG